MAVAMISPSPESVSDSGVGVRRTCLADELPIDRREYTLDTKRFDGPAFNGDGMGEELAGLEERMADEMSAGGTLNRMRVEVKGDDRSTKSPGSKSRTCRWTYMMAE